MKRFISMMLFATVCIAGSATAQHAGGTDIHDSLQRTVAPAATSPRKVEVKRKLPSHVSPHDVLRSPKEKMKEQVMMAYVCPDHPNLFSDKPGRCAECGTLLSRGAKKNSKGSRLYTCNVHRHVSGKKNDECWECGNQLVLLQQNKNKRLKHETACQSRSSSGKCLSCSSDMLRSAKEKMKMDVMKSCCCPRD